jgi:hypothetical protein
MYMAAANEMTERKMFAVSSLEDTIKKYKAYENNASLL